MHCLLLLRVLQRFDSAVMSVCVVSILGCLARLKLRWACALRFGRNRDGYVLNRNSANDMFVHIAAVAAAPGLVLARLHSAAAARQWPPHGLLLGHWRHASEASELSQALFDGRASNLIGVRQRGERVGQVGCLSPVSRALPFVFDEVVLRYR